MKLRSKTPVREVMILNTGKLNVSTGDKYIVPAGGYTFTAVWTKTTPTDSTDPTEATKSSDPAETTKPSVRQDNKTGDSTETLSLQKQLNLKIQPLQQNN